MGQSKVFSDVAVSLDGFIAPEGMDMAHADDPGYEQWMNQHIRLESHGNVPEERRSTL